MIHSGNISKGNENNILKRYLHSHIYCSIIHNCHDWIKPKHLSTDEWIKKMWYIQIINCAAMREKEILPSATTFMDLEGCYAEWDKPDRERHILHGITYTWNPKRKIKLIETELKSGCQSLGGGGKRERW